MNRDILLSKVLEVIRREELTAYAIGKKVKMSPTGIQKIIDGETKRPTENTLKAILSAISPDYDDSYDQIADTLTDQYKKEKMVPHPTEGYIPVYDIAFTLGFTPTFIDSRNNPEILGYVNFPELRGSTYVVKAKGDSMAPLINDKDFVGIRPVKNKNTIDYGNPYGLITEDLAVFKRIRKSESRDKITLLSDNPEHDSYDISKEEVIHLFSVIGILSVKSITY